MYNVVCVVLFVCVYRIPADLSFRVYPLYFTGYSQFNPPIAALALQLFGITILFVLPLEEPNNYCCNIYITILTFSSPLCRLLDQGDIPKNVFMVFEYLEYDLTGIIESPEIKISQDHIKSWSKQLLSGVHYMHVNKIIHRDLKSSNLLINKRGELKIADWGLARSWNKEMKRLTNRVITLWYRPPELLLGCNQYTTKIDMWSVGCIIAEMFRRGGLLKGSTEANQLDLIFKTMGHPTREDWPDIDTMCPLWKNFEPKSGEQVFPRRLREELKARLSANAMNWMTPHAMDMIDNLLAHNPEKRWSADKALLAEYFFDSPTAKPASELNMKFGVESAHEWEARKKHKEMMAKKLAARGLPAPGSSSSGRTKS